MRDQADVAEVLPVTVMARKAGWAEAVLGVQIGPERGEMMSGRTNVTQASGQAGAEGAERTAPQQAGHQALVIPESDDMFCVTILNEVNRSHFPSLFVG